MRVIRAAARLSTAGGGHDDVVVAMDVVVTTPTGHRCPSRAPSPPETPERTSLSTAEYVFRALIQVA